MNVRWSVLRNGTFPLVLLLAGCGPEQSQDSPALAAAVASAASSQPARQAAGGGTNDSLGKTTAPRSWHRAMSKLHPSKAGCFKSTFPSTSWEEIPCGAPSNVPLVPGGSGHPAGAPLTVGGTRGVDYMAQTAGISWAEGSFPVVQGVTSVSSYSLQLNSDIFAGATNCWGSSCKGWQQFAYSPAFGGKIEYWLVAYGPPGSTTCPAGWGQYTSLTYGNSCWMDSATLTVPTQSITNLADIAVTGVASTSDGLIISVGNTIYQLWAPSVLGLSGKWGGAEFNVFGYGNGAQAVFNWGSQITVQTLVDAPSSSAPSCTNKTNTGETSNLTLVPNSCCPMAGSPMPGIQFTETYPAQSPTVSCPVAPVAASWSAIGHPFDAITTGTDVDGTPLMSCRSSWNGVQVGKTRAEWDYCDIGYAGSENAIAPYVSLTGGWVADTVANGTVPASALPFGNDGSGGPTLYACRGYLSTNVGGYTGGYQLGKIRPGLSGCYVPFNGTEQAISTYEVLTTQTPLLTYSVSGTNPPSNALIGGFDADGAPLFVCQAFYAGGQIPGKTRSSWTQCDVSYNGQEVFLYNYNVLVPNFQTSAFFGVWPAGTDSNGSSEGICNVNYSDPTYGSSVQVGKYINNDACDFTFNGSEISATTGYEVLANP
jgi:hypothetical protein